ncbi:uncharacterized protein LOC132552576 [Ylistrum balloti]|uniref:uncharacterized protein LOC132552576 n=1 Tax=Ylistrum balloti TaxID=509963 RepID=UPI002905CCF7|nr:uncharacterized protein LOC132552576 [Ylistrum balloti]
MEADVIPVTEDEVGFDPQDLLEDPARQEISQTSLEIMQLLAECEGGREVFGNIHQGNFIYDNASLVGSSSELSDIFQDDTHTNIDAEHRLDNILAKSIESMNKSPKKKKENCQEDQPAKKKQRKLKDLSQKSSKPKTSLSRSKNDRKGDTDRKLGRKRREDLAKSWTSEDSQPEKQETNTVRNICSSSDIASCLRFKKNSEYEIDDDGTYTCKICGKKFTTVKCLLIHSTKHRQKVKLVRKTPSKTESDQQQSRKKRGNSEKKMIFGIINENNSCKGLSISDMWKSATSSGVDSALCDQVQTDQSGPGSSTIVSPVDEFNNGSALVLNDFRNERKGNATCSKILETLSRHGAKEYLTLSAKKYKKICKKETFSTKKYVREKTAESSSIVKTSNRQLQETQKKSVTSRGQNYETRCTKKKKGVDRCDEEKFKLKNVCVQVKFQDGSESNHSNDSAYLSTVDPNPKTNGGLLQCFDKSLESSDRRHQRKVHVRRGQLVRKKRTEVCKSTELKACVSQQVFKGNSFRRNIPEVKDDSLKSSLGSDTFTSKCSCENEELVCNLFDDRQNTTFASPSKDTILKEKSVLDTNSNLNSHPAVCQAAQMYDTKTTEVGNQKLDNNEGSGIDLRLESYNNIGPRGRKDLSRNQDKKNNIHSEIFPHQGKQTVQQVTQGTDSKGDNCLVEEQDRVKSAPNQIPTQPSRTFDGCVNSDSSNKDALVPGSYSREVEDKQTLSSNDKVPSTQPLQNGKTVIESSVSRQLSHELQVYSEEECYERDGRNETDSDNSVSSDDESEPLVLYKQSCRTLPLCALLNLARHQKLENDMSRNIYGTSQENAVETQNSTIKTCTEISDVECGTVDQQVELRGEKDTTGHIKNTSPLSVDKITSHKSSPEMMRSMSTNDRKEISGMTSVGNINTSKYVSDYLQVEQLQSVNVSKSVASSADTVPGQSTVSGSCYDQGSDCQNNVGLLSTDPVKSPLKISRGAFCVDERHEDFIENGSKSNRYDVCSTQEYSVLQPTTEQTGWDLSMSPVEFGDRGDILEKSVTKVDCDVKKHEKVSVSNECTISSLRSISDDNCVEVTIFRRCSTSSDNGEECRPVVTSETVGEDVNNGTFTKYKFNQNIMESDIWVNELTDKHFDGTSVDDRCSQSQNVVHTSMYTSEHDNISFSRKPDLGCKQYQTEPQETLPKNVMSTCNFVGSFADDMVTGITNVVDTDTNSSSSSLVGTKYHDYCARQISYQNFLQCKLDEKMYQDCSLENSVCARSVPFQDFHKIKGQDLTRSENDILNQSEQVCPTTVFERDAGSQNLEIQLSCNMDKAIYMHADDSFKGSGQQPDVVKDMENSAVRNESGVDFDSYGNKSESPIISISTTDLDQNVSRTSESCQSMQLESKNQQTILSVSAGPLLDNAINPTAMCSSGAEDESSEDVCDTHVNIDKFDTCARVQPFETNIMHKFSDKTKVLFREYHDRQQNSRDIFDNADAEKYYEADLVSTDICTQTVSSLEENECSMYEIHTDSISPNPNFSEYHNMMNVKNDRSCSSFSEITSEEGVWSTESLKNSHDSISASSKGFNTNDILDSKNPELTPKSDVLPFKSSMNVLNLQDISTSVLNQQNIPLTEEEQRYLKSPKKLWYRHYMDGISATDTKEKKGDNSYFECSSHQNSFIFPELCDSKPHEDNGDKLSNCFESDTVKIGKENTPDKTLNIENRDFLCPEECNSHLCEAVIGNGEESQSTNINRQSDTEYLSDTSVRFEMCSRMRQFRKRRSCARACRDGYVPGCARSRIFTKNK